MYSISNKNSNMAPEKVSLETEREYKTIIV
jgi:hypothetical protein